MVKVWFEPVELEKFGEDNELKDSGIKPETMPRHSITYRTITTE